MSKLTINLYTQALRPKREYLSLLNLSIAVLLLLVLLLLMRIQVAWQDHSLAQQREQTQYEMNQVQQQISELAERARSQRVDQALQAHVEQLERDVRGLQTLSGAVLQSAALDDALYAPLLRDLSAIHQPGLWLEHIENNQGRLILKGYTEHSGHLPRWMGRFSSVASLAGKQFAVVALESDDNNVLRFEVRSQREQGGE